VDNHQNKTRTIQKMIRLILNIASFIVK